MKVSKAYCIFTIINVLGFALFAFICFYPFYYIVVNSFNGTPGHTAFFFPDSFTLENYKLIFEQANLWHVIFISVLRAVLGTLCTLLVSSMFAFVLTQKLLPLRRSIYRLTVVTMYFSAGVVPTYVTYLNYGLKNNFLVYILPSAVSVYNMILIKTYMESIDSALIESAVIDGAAPIMCYARIILPLCVPILATVAVFSVVGQWNAWFDNFMYVNDPNLQTLQYTAQKLITQADTIAKQAMQGANIADLAKLRVGSKEVRMAISTIAVIPVMMFYPFMQRYYVKGIMLGSVKG